MPFSLPKLNYSHSGLEPYIDAQTMEIHHSKHHQAYVDNLNKALAGSANENKSLEELLAVISTLSPAIRNNGGGHWNHSFFWQIVVPPSQSGQVSETLRAAINRDLGGLDALKETFNQAAMKRFGSGWAWLIVQEGKLRITSTANQDNPLMDIVEAKGTPILGVDVWEHAYYLKYQNRRADYLKAFWSLINWKLVSQLYKG